MEGWNAEHTWRFYDEDRLESVHVVCRNCRRNRPREVVQEFWRRTDEGRDYPGVILDDLGIEPMCCRRDFLAPLQISRRYGYGDESMVGEENPWETRPHGYYIGSQEQYVPPQRVRGETIATPAQREALRRQRDVQQQIDDDFTPPPKRRAQRRAVVPGTRKK